MKFSVCIDAVFYGKDVYESIELLAKNGIRNIEFWTWWDKDINRLLELKERYELTYVAFCSKFYSLVDTGERETYMNGFQETCETAKKIGCNTIITKPLDKTGEAYEGQYQNMRNTLQRCTGIAKKYDITIVIEPVNSVYEAPNTFMDNSSLAFQLVDDIQDKHLKVLYDIYHMQIDEGNVVKRIMKNIHKIGHIHVAGSQDRHELTDGELNYDYIFDKIGKTDYDGYVGLEYFPAQDEIAGILEVTKKY